MIDAGALGLFNEDDGLKEVRHVSKLVVTSSLRYCSTTLIDAVALTGEDRGISAEDDGLMEVRRISKLVVRSREIEWDIA